MAAKPTRTQGIQCSGRRDRSCPHPTQGGARRATGRRLCRSPGAQEVIDLDAALRRSTRRSRIDFAATATPRSSCTCPVWRAPGRRIPRRARRRHRTLRQRRPAGRHRRPSTGAARLRARRRPPPATTIQPPPASRVVSRSRTQHADTPNHASHELLLQYFFVVGLLWPRLCGGGLGGTSKVAKLVEPRRRLGGNPTRLCH